MTTPASARVGVDVGGTFTDLVLHDPVRNIVRTGKLLTTPDDPSEAILRYARANHVSMIVMGAATHGLQMQRFVATVPIKVALRAPCTLILVKQSPPPGAPLPRAASAVG